MLFRGERGSQRLGRDCLLLWLLVPGTGTVFAVATGPNYRNYTIYYRFLLFDYCFSLALLVALTVVVVVAAFSLWLLLAIPVPVAACFLARGGRCLGP